MRLIAEFVSHRRGKRSHSSSIDSNRAGARTWCRVWGGSSKGALLLPRCRTRRQREPETKGVDLGGPEDWISVIDIFLPKFEKYRLGYCA